MENAGAFDVGAVEEELRGTLANATVVDVLQFLHVAGRTGALVIERGASGEDATVYLSNGNVSHVVVGDATGLDALVRLMGWERGSFRFTAGVVCPVVTIDASFQASVMEAIRLHDERARQPQDAPSAPLHARQLEELAELPGVRAAALLPAGDDPPLVAGDLTDADPRELEAAVRSTMETGAAVGALVGGAGVEELILAFGELDVMACPVREAWLVVVTGGDAQLGVVRHKTRRLADAIRGGT